MQNSILLKLLKTFSKEEFREFNLLVSSPYYNREKVIVKLTDILKKHYPEFSSVNIDKKTIFSVLYPDKKYNDALFRNTVSDYLKIAEEFLKISHLKKDPFNDQYLLLKELTNRKQQKLFNTNFKKTERILKVTGIRDEIYFQNKFLLEDEKRRNIVVNSSRVLFKDDNLNKQAFNLHLQQLIENIKLYAIMLNQNKFTYDHNYDFTLFEILRSYIEKNFHLYKNIPYLIIFYNCVMLFKTEEKKYFDELKMLTGKHYLKLSLTDRKNMFIVLTNHGTARIKKGEYEFYSELFEIYREMLRRKAYLEGNNFMPHYFYNSITLNALAIKKTDWAEDFVFKYKKLIHSDFRETSFNYCYANVLLEKGEFESALETLSSSVPLDITFKIYFNITLLKIYFCKNETESFLSLIDSFRHFLKRNKDLRSDDRIFHNNFTLHLKKLYQQKNKDGNKDVAELMFVKNGIIKSGFISYKKWLLDKADEIENEFKIAGK